jgi:three-Cys-motif partner protein
MMAQIKFGGAHTERKLQKLEAYLRAYTTALKNQNFHLIYFDAFAGTGDIPRSDLEAPMFAAEEYEFFIAGSAERALNIPTKFDEYIFVESSAKKVDRLSQLLARYPDLSQRIVIERGDANIEVERFCSERNWRTSRAVVFLDPFGNQVAWETIVAIAETEAIDLWYLFPAGLGVHRQIGRDGKIYFQHGPSLDRLFGTTDWKDAFIEEQPRRDLFGQTQSVSAKLATPESITRFMIQRMREVFRGGVLDIWLPLGSKGVHMYSLLFAWANPSPKAKLAGKLAQAVLRSKTSGRIKRH